MATLIHSTNEVGIKYLHIYIQFPDIRYSPNREVNKSHFQIAMEQMCHSVMLRKINDECTGRCRLGVRNEIQCFKYLHVDFIEIASR